MGKIKTIWDLILYDVWGNAEDGFEVNDVFFDREVIIYCNVETHNKGSKNEFKSAYPTDRQLKKILGYDGPINTNGDDLNIYVNAEDDSYPLGELRLRFPQSLSPIKNGKMVRTMP